MRFIKPLLLILGLAGLGFVIWRSGLGHQLTWGALARHQAVLAGLVSAHPVLAPVTYAAIYAALVAFSVPESALVTVTGGLLFGTLLGGALAVAGSTVGAVALFLVARSAFAGAVSRRAGATMERVRTGLHRDGFSYLLAIRLVPALPFWLVNLAAALCGMRLIPYAAATLIGIIPATFVLAWIGSGVGDVLAAGRSPNFRVLFSFPVLGPLLLLACLSLLPVLLRHLRSANGRPGSNQRFRSPAVEPSRDNAPWELNRLEEADDPARSPGVRARHRAERRANLGADQS